MTWLPVDCHAHTTMSDGALEVSALVERARGRGVRPSVSDHISRDVAGSIKTVAGVREYLDTLDEYPVLRGGEFCWHDALWREIPADLVPRFTHWVGSIHAVHLGDGTLVHAFARKIPESLEPAAYMEAHLDEVERFAAEMPVDILAHPTLIPISLRSLPFETLWTEEQEDRLTRALARARIAFEVSGRYRPHERIVRRALDNGVRISLGSDGHTADQVANLEFSLTLTRSLGVPDEELYDPVAHGSKTQAVRA
jgi:Histidinol phosphatase and related hydrolases of the PHP family